MDELQLKRFQKRVKVRWPDLFDIDDEEKGRAYLVDLALVNIERLNELIDEFEKMSDETARRNVDCLRRDDTPERAPYAPVRGQIQERTRSKDGKVCQVLRKDEGSGRRKPATGQG